DTSIAREDMARLARHVGYGVADAIIGGAVISSLRAAEETTTSVLSQGQIALVLVPAAADLSDAEVFQTAQAISSADVDPVADQPLLALDQRLIDAVSRGDGKQLALMMHTDFQPARVQIIPERPAWLTAGMDDGALAAQTADRGPSLLFVAAPQDAAYQL